MPRPRKHASYPAASALCLLCCLDAQAPQDRIVALGLELVDQLGAARLDDAAIRHNVNGVRSYVVQDALVMGDEQDAHAGLLLVHRVDAVTDDSNSVDVQT